MISMSAARRYGRVMAKIEAMEKEAAFNRTPEGQAKLARDQANYEAAAVAEAARVRKLAGPIPFTGNRAGVVFGTNIDDGSDFVVPAKQLQHTLISGVAGSGKSVLQHLLVSQLVQSPDVKRLTLIDLKGGIEFDRYSDSSKVRVVWKFADVVRVIDDLMPFMERRQEEMRQRRLQNWPGPKSIVVIDEFAEIQTEMDVAETKEEKATAKRLEANLVSISRRARALGIVLICALQKATTDAMSSGLRNNLSCRLVLRTATNALAASMLDDLERLAIKPTMLPTGRFIYYDASRGITKYLQAQIAPGVTLDGY